MANNQLIEKMIENISEYKQFDFFKKLNDSIEFSSSQANINGHFLQQEIDIEWIQAIEKCIIPLDNIIRTPRKFIKNDEDIVPIALARGITTDSIKHLAQHTNMIHSVEDDTVTPNRILEVRKEESFETYENRFIYTLLTKLQYFLDKRMGIINEKTGTDNEYDVSYSGSFNFDKDKINYQIKFNYQIPNKTDLADISKLVQQDVSSLTTLQRIERLRKILYDFQASQFMKKLIGAPLIRPPLTMTNLLAKNPDYKACVDLWLFVENYRGTGLSLNVVDQNITPSSDIVNKFSSLTAMYYSFIRNYTSGIQEVQEDVEENKKTIEENIEQIINKYDFDIAEVKRIFTDRIEKKERRMSAYEKRMVAIIKEAIVDERAYKLERQGVEKQKRLEILRKEAERKRQEQQEERRLLKEKLELERLELKKQKEEERQAKLEEQRLLKERFEQEKLELQKQIEEERLAILEEQKLLKEEERQARLEQQNIQKEILAQEKLELQRQKEAQKQAYLEELRKQKEEEKQARLEEQRILNEKLAYERLELQKKKEAELLESLEKQRLQKEKLIQERLELIRQKEARKQELLEQLRKQKEKAATTIVKVNSIKVNPIKMNTVNVKPNKPSLPDKVVVESIKPVSIVVKPIKPLSNNAKSKSDNFEKMARLRAMKQAKNNLTNTKVVQSNVNNNIEVKPIKFMTNQEKMAHVRSFKKS